MQSTPENVTPTFYTVHEAAELFRVNPVTLYRAIQEDAFPAVRIRRRYAIPAAAVRQLIEEVTASGGCIDLAELVTARREQRQFARATEGRQR